jgi:hypothetical protein
MTELARYNPSVEKTDQESDELVSSITEPAIPLTNQGLVGP